MPDVTMNAGRVNIVITADGANFTAAMNAANKQLGNFQKNAQGAGHSMVSNTQAASAAIRLMEGDLTNLVRAAERFVGQSQMLSGVLKNAFPVIGAIAITAVLAEGIQRVEKFINTARKVPRALQDGLQSFTLSQESMNDSLQVANDKLEMEIGRIEHKPTNGLKLALDESKEAADKLAGALQNDLEKMDGLLKAHQINIFGSLLTDQGGTANVTGSVESYEHKLSDLGYRYAQAIRQHNDALAGNIKQQLDATRNSAHRYSKSTLGDINRYTKSDAVGNTIANVLGVPQLNRIFGASANNQDANRLIVETFDQSITDSQTREQEESRNKSLDARRQSDEAHVAQARQAAEAEQKAQEAIIQGFHRSLDSVKAAQDLTLTQEANFWIDRATTVRDKSKSYIAAIDEAHKVIAQQWAQTGRERTKFEQSTSQDEIEDLHASSDIPSLLSRYIPQQSREGSDYLQSLNEGIAIRQRNADAMSEVAIRTAEATGQMSKYDAAQAMAALHAQQYSEALERLQTNLAEIANMPGLTPMDRNRQLSGTQNQIDLLNGSRAVQLVQENAAINSGSLGGSIQEMLNLYVQKATDAAAQIREVMTSAFESLNSTVASSLMAHAYTGRDYRRNLENGLSGATRGIGSQLLNAGFHEVEGGVLGKFGLGGAHKPAGTAGDPLYVKLAAMGVANPSLPTSLLTSSESGGSGLTSLIPSVLGSVLQGAFAGGGDVVGGRPALIGENGPEIFTPSSAGHITPNSKIGGSVEHHYHMPVSIDARGASDPAAVEASVNRAMASWGPRLVAASVGAFDDRARRSPSSKRY